MIGYFKRLPDPQVQDEFNLLVDAANNLAVRLDALKDSLDRMKIPTMRDIQVSLEQGGSNPLNLTGLQGRGGT